MTRLPSKKTISITPSHGSENDSYSTAARGHIMPLGKYKIKIGFIDPTLGDSLVTAAQMQTQQITQIKIKYK